VERRARRRAQIRRRRITALAGFAVVIAAVVVVLTGVIGSGAAGNNTASGPANSPSHHTAHKAASRRPGAQGTLAAEMAKGNAEIERLARLGLPIYCAGHHGNEVAFTFDDGPGVYTHYAVRKLAQAGERATFFVVGKSMNAWPGWLPRELRVGAVEDHTYHHLELIALSPSQIQSELGQTKQMIESQTGETVDMWRPPYGLHNATTDEIAKNLGLLDILWNVDSRDSLGANYAGIIQNVEAGLKPGNIIEMHENRGQTIRALTTLLPELRRRHMRSVSLPELFASDPPSVAQVRAGPAGCSLGGGGSFSAG
jgi:peptidoglycan/xylan/chitin deacetylase (PgdA/CDA1 family)